MMANTELILLNSAIIILIGILGYLMKRSINGIDEKLKEAGEERGSLKKEIQSLKEQRGFDREYFAKEYVSKDDFVRDIRALDYKIDLVSADVKKLLMLAPGRWEENA